MLGEVVMEPDKVVPYFGSVEKPECYLIYHVTTMGATWNSVATKAILRLGQQMNVVSGLPKDCIFLNYLRCHDANGWGLDCPWLKQFGIDEVSYKRIWRRVLDPFYSSNSTIT